MKTKILIALAATAFLATSAMAATQSGAELAWGYQQKQKQNGGGSSNSSSSVAWGYQQKQKQNGGGSSSSGA